MKSDLIRFSFIHRKRLIDLIGLQELSSHDRFMLCPINFAPRMRKPRSFFLFGSVNEKLFIHDGLCREESSLSLSNDAKICFVNIN